MSFLSDITFQPPHNFLRWKSEAACSLTVLASSTNLLYRDHRRQSQHMVGMGAVVTSSFQSKVLLPSQPFLAYVSQP
jgi:hypothetical protein